MDYSDNNDGSDNNELPDNDILDAEDLFNDEANEEEDGNESSKISESSKEKIEKKLKPKKIVKNPRVKLNFDTLKGPNGLPALKKLFTNFKFKGNNHEQEDLTKIMGILQQWMCFKLCPSYDFESCMSQLEALGKKKVVQTYIKKFRLGLDEWGESKSDNEDYVDKDAEILEEPGTYKENFDSLLDKEIENVDIENDMDFSQIGAVSIENTTRENLVNLTETEINLTPEQLERIAKNRKMAEERRLKRMNVQQEHVEISENSVKIVHSQANSIED